MAESDLTHLAETYIEEGMHEEKYLEYRGTRYDASQLAHHKLKFVARNKRYRLFLRPFHSARLPESTPVCLLPSLPPFLSVSACLMR